MIKNRRGQIPEEIRQKALTMLETEDIDTVSATLRIRKAALLKMVQASAVPTPPKEEATTEPPPPPENPTVAERKMPYYSPEFKAEALAMMEEKGAVTTIKELGISSYTLYDWKRKAQGQKYPLRQGPLAGKTRKRYTPEFKAEVIEYYQSHGAGDTLEKYGIVNNTLFNWLNEEDIKRVGNLHIHKADHTDAIALYQEKGTEAVLEEYGISKSTLNSWLKAAGIDTARKPKYSPEFKERAVAIMKEMSVAAVASELGIPVTTLYNWMGQAQKK